ncbi:hypothetical protein SB18R_03260 [Pseudomonas oryzihabitans]|nr:hypothetical protein SB9_12495 [Pseudomonas psychrotolerans]KTT78262.1 hypothetical protein SB18R_03260 [Pseudomonas psychrotolerans]
MRNRLVKQGVSTYTPGVPAVVGRPAYCTSEVVTELVWVDVGGTTRYVNSYDTSLAAGRNLDRTGNTIYVGLRVQEPRQMRRTVCYPAVPVQPGRDAVASYDAQIGWNAGASSILLQDGDLIATFVLDRAPNGVLCGLASSGVASGDFSSIEHGLYSDGGRYQVYESGRLVFTSGQMAVNQPALAIGRAGETVTYYIGTERYVSGKPSHGAKRLAASLYVAGDYVDSPALGPARSLSADIQLELDGVAVTTVGDGKGSNPGGSTTLPMVAVVELDLSGSAFLGNQPAVAPSPPVVDVSALVVSLPVVMSAVCTEVVVETGRLALDLVVRGDEELSGYGQAEFTVEVSAWEEAPLGLRDDYFETILGLDAYDSPLVVYSLIQESLTIGSQFDILIALGDDLFELLALRDRLTVAMLLRHVIQERLSVSDDARVAQQMALQYATNLATGAVTRYQGYDFGGYLQVDGQTLAWRPNGLYRLGGATDNGQLLEAMLEFAAEDFGTNAAKFCDWIYLGLTSDGEAVVKILDDNGAEYVYQVRGESPTVRAQLSRGLRSTLWRMRLQVSQASQLDLDSVEWVIRSSTRRLTR